MEWLLGLPEESRAKQRLGYRPLPVSCDSATTPNPAWHPKQLSLGQWQLLFPMEKLIVASE